MFKNETTRSLTYTLIAQTKENGGVTVDVKREEIISPIDGWLFPELPMKTGIYTQTENLAGEIESFIKNNGDSLEKPGRYLGLWVHPQTQEFYLDICIVEKDKEKALQTIEIINQVSSRKILAMYNPILHETVTID